MKSGRELDALVAKKVMGWKHIGADGPNGEPGCVDPDQIETPLDSLPHHSTDIAAAWKVVEKICGDDFNFTMNFVEGEATFLEYQEQDDGPMWHEDIEHTGNSESMPHAICLAALKAMGVEV